MTRDAWRLMIVLGLMPCPAAMAQEGLPARGDGLRVLESAWLEPRAGGDRWTVAVLADEDGLPVVLETARPASGVPPRQHALEDSERPPEGMDAIVIEDLDGDGLKDLRVLAWWGATGNTGWFAWRFDAEAGDLVAVPGFRELSSPVVDRATRCIRTRQVGGAAGAVFRSQLWCWRAGKLELTWEEVQDFQDGALVRVTRERRDGMLVETKREAGDPGE
jgi:hypothetical protein